jgi:hypothetical protein
MTDQFRNYLVAGVIVTALAGVEFYHEFAHDDGPGGAVCMAPESQKEAFRDMLLVHLRSH